MGSFHIGWDGLRGLLPHSVGTVLDHIGALESDSVNVAFDENLLTKKASKIFHDIPVVPHKPAAEVSKID